jgi:3-hydroxy-3-methylglutaryl CoA synthase
MRGAHGDPETGVGAIVRQSCLIVCLHTIGFQPLALALPEKHLAGTTSIGISSVGAFIPRRRMSRAAIAEAHAWAFPSLKSLANGERSMCNWDEDVITMAVEASRDCLRGVPPGRITALDLASTTAPYADLQNAVIASAALSLDASTSCTDFSGSTRAGLTALVRACSARGAHGRLVVAADKRRAKPGSTQELQIGYGAAAALVDEGDDLLARFLGSASVSVPFIDHFRQAGTKYDYGWEERWVRDEGISKIVPATINTMLERIGRSTGDMAFLGLAGGPIGSDKLVAKLLGVSGDRILPDFQGQVGDTGTAQSLLQLIVALERGKPGDLVLVAAFAQGCEVAAFEILRPSPSSARRGVAGSLSSRISESAYLKMLSFDGEIELDWGMRTETDNKTSLTELYRSADQVLGFVGGKCGKCGAIQFPRMPACVNCGATASQTPYALADEPARVATYTADWLMYTPGPPLYVGLVQFDVGARVLMEIVDIGAQSIEVGTPLEMTLRIKERDQMRHFDRYCWKATPRPSASGDQ